jgi:hypothetical protein
MVIAPRVSQLDGEVGGSGERLDQRCRKKMCCTKLFLCYVLVIHQ